MASLEVTKHRQAQEALARTDGPSALLQDVLGAIQHALTTILAETGYGTVQIDVEKGPGGQRRVLISAATSYLFKLD